MKCKFCGCTDARACPGGCSWFMHEVCSQCAEAAVRAYAPYPVTYSFITTYMPRGVRKAEVGADGVEYIRRGQLDMMPVAGMRIDAGDGDMRKVSEVMFDAEQRELLVIFEPCDFVARTHKFMVDQGWKKLS